MSNFHLTQAAEAPPPLAVPSGSTSLALMLGCRCHVVRALRATEPQSNREEAPCQQLRIDVAKVAMSSSMRGIRFDAVSSDAHGHGA